MNTFKFFINLINKFLKSYFFSKKKKFTLIIFFFYIVVIFYTPSYFNIHDLNNIEKHKKILTGRIYQLNGVVYKLSNEFFIKTENNKPNYTYKIIFPDLSKKELKNFEKLIGRDNQFLLRFNYNDLNFINEKTFKLHLLKIL